MAIFCGHSNRTYVSINQEFLAQLSKSQHCHDNVWLPIPIPERKFQYLVPYGVLTSFVFLVVLKAVSHINCVHMSLLHVVNVYGKEDFSIFA